MAGTTAAPASATAAPPSPPASSLHSLAVTGTTALSSALGGGTVAAGPLLAQQQLHQQQHQQLVQILLSDAGIDEQLYVVQSAACVLKCLSRVSLMDDAHHDTRRGARPAVHAPRLVEAPRSRPFSGRASRVRSSTNWELWSRAKNRKLSDCAIITMLSLSRVSISCCSKSHCTELCCLFS